jgi:DNA-binding IclR family transcriptional regulator
MPNMEQRSKSADGKSADGSVQLERGLDMLEFLAGAGSPQGLTDIAGQVGGPKATVHRLLATLQQRGYVTQDPHTARYSAGVRCFELGSRWAQNLDLRTIASPALVELNETTGETVHLAVYDHGDAVYVDKLDCRHPVVAVSHVGRRSPATCVATGRALLAFQSREEIDSVCAGPLPAYTELSVTDPAELVALLGDVRKNGYGVNRGSYRTGVGGLAAPIRDHTGQVVASVGICLPEQRFGDDRFEELRAATVRAAVAISEALGGPGALVTSSGSTRSGD